MDQVTLLAMISGCLEKAMQTESGAIGQFLENVSFENDHKSGEMILDTRNHDGQKQSWVIRSSSIEETE